MRQTRFHQPGNRRFAEQYQGIFAFSHALILSEKKFQLALYQLERISYVPLRELRAKSGEGEGREHASVAAQAPRSRNLRRRSATAPLR